MHGWADDPTKGWIAWLVKELTNQGIAASAPFMRQSKNSQLDDWVALLRRETSRLDAQTVVVGHSLGCAVVLGLLDEMKPTTTIAGLVLVAGAIGKRQFDLAKIRQMARERICIVSDNDRIVPPKLTKAMAKQLDARVVVDPGHGHFLGLKSCDKLPSAKLAVLECFPP